MDIPAELLNAVQELEPHILAVPGINGIGIGLRESDGEVFDELAVRVLVQDASAVPPVLPTEIAGVDICVIEREYLPLSGPPDRTRYSQLRGGIQITNPGMADAGTLGVIVEDASATSSGERLGLSCFHVVGDRGSRFSVWQPNHPPQGPSAPQGDSIGRVRVAKFPDTPVVTGLGPIRVGGVDAAVFTLKDGLQQESPSSRRTLSAAIMGKDEQHPLLASAIRNTEHAHTTLTVTKRGAATRVTHGMVLAPYMSTAWKALGPGRHILGSIEVMAHPLHQTDGVFCLPGDSGSVVLRSGHPIAVGLLWGGSPSGSHGLMTDIKLVESELEISLVWSSTP